ncbi:MAG: transcriptional regulator [Flavobacteriales bacterium]|nr:transcriptional regulator [Flavobacteriales bacterium]
MTENELKIYIHANFPIENEACEWKEFKSLKHSFSGTSGNDIISYVSALANMEGGNLIIGIEDNTLEIVGIQDFNNHTAQNIRLRILTKCPNLDSEHFTIEDIETTDSKKTVWIFHIPKHLPRRPVSAHERYWQRVDDSLVELRKERLEAILKEPLFTNDDWSAQIVPNATLDDLDPQAIEKARKEYKEKNPRKASECDTWDNITFLNKAKVTLQGKITNTALLLLGKEESSHFLSPAVAKISWILKDENNVELDYEHFGVPFLLSSTEVFSRVRNLTYRYIKDDSLFPTEIKMYDAFVIREALHNCIAHQDYHLKGRITVVEKPDELLFTNLGDFIPKSIDKVIEQDAPQEYYRNQFLADAMVNLNMIDTIGSGIKRMFLKQMERFFPMPDFDLSTPNKVAVKIAGRIWDVNYTKLLMSKTDLDLKMVVLLDRVQKNLPITDDEIKQLKKVGLIEGRKPNIHVSAKIAEATQDQSTYIKLRGFKDEYYKKLILEYLDKYKQASKTDIDNLILDILPEILDEEKKQNKVRNLVYAMSKKDKTIVNKGTTRYPKWEKV